MSLNNQPVRGIIPVLCVVISSIIFIGIGQGTFGINPDMLSVYALFFVWAAFIVSLAGNWPLEKVKQPLRGITYLGICLVGGVLHPLIISWLGYGSETYWPLISNLFLGIGIIIAFDNPFVNCFSQPKAVFFNALFCYVFAIILMVGYGFVPSIWFAMFVYYFFWVEKWPLQQVSQPVKGILAFTVLGFLSLIFWQAYSMAGTSFFKPEGGLFFVLFVWWLVMFSWNLETWPVQKVAQPIKGIIGLTISLILTVLSYAIILKILVIDPGTAGSIVWIFVSWLYTWDIVLSKWPADQNSGLSQSSELAETATA
ncbi:hypothetical protein RSJ42_06740 [Methanosarcina hadiensis]|uniref:hypothetical protein n=1 Tax=Methanosarcina hadiensis TaxID=3078083 RepID=UPI003977C212